MSSSSWPSELKLQRIEKEKFSENDEEYDDDEDEDDDEYYDDDDDDWDDDDYEDEEEDWLDDDDEDEYDDEYYDDEEKVRRKESGRPGTKKILDAFSDPGSSSFLFFNVFF